MFHSIHLDSYILCLGTILSQNTFVKRANFPFAQSLTSSHVPAQQFLRFCLLNSLPGL
jgi:hypothetical protein